MLVTWGLGNPVGVLNVTSIVDSFEIDIIGTEIELEAEPVEFHVHVLPDKYDSWVDPPVLSNVLAEDITTILEVCT